MTPPVEAVAARSDAVAELRRAGLTEVDDSSLTRAMYSTDASLYRVVPQVVVAPRHRDELLAVVEVARATGTPITMRGAGTSIAGNAVGTGIVVDTSRHLTRLSLDEEAGTARVEPGVVHARLQERATRAGLRFGPDPSTHTRCTVGGMIGNNACGSRALGYGRTVDNVLALDVVTGSGDRLVVGEAAAGSAMRGSAATRSADASSLLTDLDRVVAADLATVRTGFGRFRRQISGLAMQHLLPENGRRVDRLLVGSEGTLAVVLEATVQLVVDAPARVLVVLGYASMADAADDVPGLLTLPLVACEGLDSRIMDVVRARQGPAAIPLLPRGDGWLFVEVTGEDAAEALDRGRAVATAADALDAELIVDPAKAAALWRIREDGAGLASRSLARPAHSGWEDAAVPPERLGGYLRAFDALLTEHGYSGVPYGHFGDGCVHVRIDFEPETSAGRKGFRSFLEQAAAQVAAFGGSLSGEHGDGRARSELLPAMYSPAALGLFEHVKGIFDPLGILNPGVLVRPRPFDADLRLAAPLREPPTSLRLVHDGGSLVSAVHRCTGVGKCIADSSGVEGVMCPSYVATRQEKDSTRGRARVLQEMVNGELVRNGWASPEVVEALDLCLACKGCARDCPTGVDMATYKAEALYQRYRRRLRPRTHYALGQLPRWVRWSEPVAPAMGLVLRLRAVQRLATSVAGVDARRRVPVPAAMTVRRWGATRVRPTAPDVVVWADTFTDHFATDAGRAAVTVLEQAGLRVDVVADSACCGLTWLSTGQLPAARRVLSRAVDVLHPYVSAGVTVLGLEPSCVAALRSEAVQLSEDPRAAEVARGVLTLAEVLERLPHWHPPDLTGVSVVAQPHCHHASVLGWEADARLLARTGARVARVGGCCGLAGTFGVERGHYEVSVKIAEHALLPAVHAAGEDAVVLADGFSCRTQLADLAGVRALHLAELLQAPTEGRTMRRVGRPRA